MIYNEAEYLIHNIVSCISLTICSSHFYVYKPVSHTLKLDSFSELSYMQSDSRKLTKDFSLSSMKEIPLYHCSQLLKLSSLSSAQSVPYTIRLSICKLPSLPPQGVAKLEQTQVQSLDNLALCGTGKALCTSLLGKTFETRQVFTDDLDIHKIVTAITLVHQSCGHFTQDIWDTGLASRCDTTVGRQ